MITRRLKYEILLLTIISALLIFLSLYDLDSLFWIWEKDIDTWKKVVNIFVAFSGLLGVFSIILFAKRKKIAYILAIANAILYLFFSFTNGLVIDGFVQILYILILFYIYIKQILIHKHNKRIRELRLSSYAAILFFIIFVVISTSFYF
ncbi:nicotinamide mononucleotide transporter [Mycoplasma sp. 6243]|uniref:nicotinamide mononucleotide transporter n=1 Tax=Mycoplasma sp. 6243 TaxID=3440865 RepID=UPI003EB8F441